nr:hypothetical protein [Salinisphaera sp. G21_0]
MNKLGTLYELGREGFGVNLYEAERWYRKAARLGNAKAIKNLRNLKSSVEIAS